MTLDQTDKLVAQWALDRGITINGKVVTQIMKAVSEMGELADATIKDDHEGFIDAVGDVLVCLTNACTLKGVTLAECYASAYNEIKDRKGFLNEHGNFIKEV
jgi:hypothetical protein